MTTRSKDDGYTNPQDVHTMATRWTRRTHEVYTKLHLREDLRQFFDMPKILWALPKLLPNPKNLSRRSHDGLGCSPEWPDVFTIIPDVAIFLHRVSIGSQNRDSVTPAIETIGNRRFCYISFKARNLTFLNDIKRFTNRNQKPQILKVANFMRQKMLVSENIVKIWVATLLSRHFRPSFWV